MPKQLLNIPSFEGGLNTALDPRDISLSELSRANNVMCDVNGIIRSQGKSIEHTIVGVLGTIVPGYGLFRFESSYGGGTASSATAGTYTGSGIFSHEDGNEFEGETIWYIMSDGSENLNAKTPLADNSWTLIGKMTTEGAVEPTFKTVYHIADEGLRISNADYENTPLSKNKWFGFIQKKNYFLNSSSTTDYYFNGWYFLDNDIKAPTSFDVSTGQFAATTVDDATAGAGFDLYIASDAGGNHDFSLVEADDGTVNYEFASSFIYDEIQESLLFQSGNVSIERVGTHTDPITSPGDDASLQLTVGVKTGYNPRITGGRIYFRKYQSNDEWVLLVDIDFEKGCRASLNDVYPNTPWYEVGGGGDGTEDAWASTPYVPVSANKPDTPIFSTFLNIESYYFLNEWTAGEPRISIGCDKTDNYTNGYPSNVSEGYKTSTIVNRRCFIANTQLYKNESSGIASGSLFRERDRIYYSAVNRFDSFPRTTHYIDVVRGDAEEYTTLVGYADRLLAFKTNTLYIINIAAQDPREWFLESQHKGIGVKKPCQTVETEDGIMWANGNGAYVYTGGDVRTTTTEDITLGSDINNISRNKISPDNWIADSGNIGVSYIRKRKQFLVVENLVNGTGLQYIYDFSSKTWTSSDVNSIIFEDVFNEITNFIIDDLGEIVFGSRKLSSGAQEEIVTNYGFSLQGPENDGTDGHVNTDGTVDGYTLTASASGSPVASYVSEAGALGLSVVNESGEGWQSCTIDYVFPTDLGAGVTYHFNPWIYALPGQFGFTTYIKETAQPDTQYQVIGGAGTYTEGMYFANGNVFVPENTTSHTGRINFSASEGANLNFNILFYSLFGTVLSPEANFFRFNNTNSISGTLETNRFRIPVNGIDIRTKDIDFGQQGLKKKIYSLYMTYRTASGSQTTPISYATDGGTTYTALNGNITDTSGAWTVSKFYPSTPIECQSIKFKITNPTQVTTLEINDMSIEYRQIHKRVA